METTWPVLTVLTFLPLVGVVFLLLIRGDEEVVVRNARNVALWVSGFRFCLRWRCYGILIQTMMAISSLIGATGWRMKASVI